MPASSSSSVPLEMVIATTLLDHRVSRTPGSAEETRALIGLQRALSETPESFFDELVQTVLALCPNAESSGVSLLHPQESCFVWPAVAGGLAAYLGEGTPRDFGPCGTVLDQDRTLLMQHPERHFTYLQQIHPPLEEVLLIPFYLEKVAVGTLWAVIHTRGRQFDAEDRRLLEGLSTFAASAYATLAKSGALAPFLRKKAP